MTRNKLMSLPAAVAAVALATIALGVFGAAAAAAPDAASGRSATVKVSHSRLGKIVVDSHGRTLYQLSSDPTRKSTCFGACATNWPPLRASGKPTVGTGLKASRIATIRRRDGRPQVAYRGHPLYRFAGDTRAGQTNGQGIVAFGGRWTVRKP
jgi:predicted lipoprotein with Yx(FWY)xxD motif